LSDKNLSAARLAAVVIAACLLIALAPKPAWAHAVLMSSSPAANSAVTGPDVTILLRYDSRVDPVRSTLTLVSPDGKMRKVSIAGQTAPNLLSAKVTGLVLKGTYVLRWQALASDGHITRGEVPFRVQ
jgi:copper resistance protein C